MTSLHEKFWYKKHPLYRVLIPAAMLFQFIATVRRFVLKNFFQQKFPVPVLVVGNLTVGGVGKTPLVIALAQQMQKKGLRVGIVSRGYGAKTSQFPYEVRIDDDPAICGDEPLLIARKSGCPVVIAPKRVSAIRLLLNKYKSQVIISDDGLQHYAMGRSIEMVVIDGQRGLGNGWCLPAGPLRESERRLKKADFIIVNGSHWPETYTMQLMPGRLMHLQSGQPIELNELTMPVAAVAGIGNPQRFFATLMQEGIEFRQYSFPDHHIFNTNELQFSEPSVVMTEKDAVKCQSFAAENWYFLPVEARLCDEFWHALWSHEQLKRLSLS